MKNLGVACMNPRGTVGRINKDEYNTLPHTKYEDSVPCGLREEDFFYVFPFVRLWELMTPRNSACTDLRGAVGRIHNKDYYSLLQTTYKSFASCSFREEDFFIFSHSKSMGTNEPRGEAILDPRVTNGRFNVEPFITLLHTKHIVVSEKKNFSFPILAHTLGSGTMCDVRGYILGPPHGTSLARIAGSKSMRDNDPRVGHFLTAGA